MLLNTANNNNTVISNVLGLQKNCIRSMFFDRCICVHKM